MDMDTNTVVGLINLAFLFSFWWKLDSKIGGVEKSLREDGDTAHTEIGTNIRRVEGKVDEINIFLRNRYAAEADRRPRPSENAQDRP